MDKQNNIINNNNAEDNTGNSYTTNSNKTDCIHL